MPAGFGQLPIAEPGPKGDVHQRAPDLTLKRRPGAEVQFEVEVVAHPPKVLDQLMACLAQPFVAWVRKGPGRHVRMVLLSLEPGTAQAVGRGGQGHGPQGRLKAAANDHGRHFLDKLANSER